MIKSLKKDILIMVGFPGSGKSTLAKKLASILNLEYLSTDLMREKMFNSPRFENAGHELVKTMSRQVYDELYKQAILYLKAKKKVIIDGTHLDTEKRKKMLKTLLSSISSDRACFILVRTPFSIIEKRMSRFLEPYNETETVFQAWLRVYNEFKTDQANGLISWPNKADDIDTIDSKDVYVQLFNKD